MNIPIETLPAVFAPSDLADLIALLRDAIESGASVGFMLPVDERKLDAFWRSGAADIAAGSRVILVAREGERVVGTVQLAFSTKDNSPHRTELQKLLVLRSHRGRGVATALMRAAETAAQAQRRNLIVLDTSASGNALRLYERCGYTRAGVIPRFACDPDGPLIDTVFYYKELVASIDPRLDGQRARIDTAASGLNGTSRPAPARRTQTE